MSPWQYDTNESALKDAFSQRGHVTKGTNLYVSTLFGVGSMVCNFVLIRACSLTGGSFVQLKKYTHHMLRKPTDIVSKCSCQKMKQQ